MDLEDMAHPLNEHAPQLEADEQVGGVAVYLFGFDAWEDMEPFCDAMAQGRDAFEDKRSEWAKWFDATDDALGVLLIAEAANEKRAFFLCIKGSLDEWGAQRRAWAEEIAASLIEHQKMN